VATNFPSSPALNDTWSVGNTIWFWNGTYWELQANTTKFSSSDNAPANTVEGDFWFESDTGKLFVRYDSTWVEVGHASDGQSFQVGDTLPSSAVGGDIWFESDTGKTFMYYADADSSQWVEIGHASDGQTFRIGDTVPTSAATGDIWFESDSGGAFIRYDSTWVELGHSVSGVNVNIDGGKSGTNYGGITALNGGSS
jgi:hypothetical protein|tara:strand:- start:441 stop:1031 length:591 start_codon:yes stop_codon:yes gene_type:complete